MSCEGNCDFTQEIQGNQESPAFTATLRAGNVQPGQTRSGSVRIAADLGNGDDAQTTRNLSVQGPAQPPPQQTVPEISGTVVDVYTGTPVKAARVFIQDSGSPPNNWEVGSDESGNFRIVSDAGKPIRPGVVSVIVEQEAIQKYTATRQAVAGQPLTGWRLTVTPLAATASPGEHPVVRPVRLRHGRPPADRGGQRVRRAPGGRPVLGAHRGRRPAGGPRHRRDRAAVHQAQGRRRR